MTKAFDTEELLGAFDLIGAAALERGQRLDFARYGGSALMLASNFRFSSEDVDIAPLEPRPDWLGALVEEIGIRKGWDIDWLNDAVGVHLSKLAGENDHIHHESFPRGGEAIGLRVFVPTADYMLALKLEALRVLSPAKGEQERDDILALMRVCRLQTVEEAIKLLARYFPVSAAAPEKLKFLMKHLLMDGDAPHGSPEYPRRSD